VRGTFSFSDLYTDVLSCTAPVDDPRMTLSSAPEEGTSNGVHDDARVRDADDQRLYAHAGMLASAKVSQSGLRGKREWRHALL
jgi:hypothetical protein